MRHRKTGRKFSRTAAHRKAMLENLATSLLVHERIQTTEAKAKELRGVVDRLISLGKRGDIHARRLAAARLKENKQALRYLNESVLDKLFNDIAKRNADRPGGYTRIYKLDRRHGDSAPMAVIELVEARQEEATVEPVEQTTTEASAE